MKKIDPMELFKNQPSADFIEELKKPVHEKKNDGFGKGTKENDEVATSGMWLNISFPDPDGLLESAYADFRQFLKVYEIDGNSYSVTVQKGKTSCFEEYTVEIAEGECTITAEDTEGIRRALVFLEDMIIEREAPFLKPGKITRRPVIKTRITRGFFSPTNRPPKNVDELWDEVDYYPDEYLNRIAHDGNNGIWIYTHFCDLIPSKIIPEYGHDSARRIKKLKSVVKKCARYGIKVYIFAVEPHQLSKELEQKHPEILGGTLWDKSHSFCTYTDAGARYCIESTEWLFREVPELGGYIDITTGERTTNCASADYKRCPRCSKHSRGEVLAHTADLIKEGMRRAGARGEFISWTYGHRAWDFEDIKDYVRAAPDDVMLMQNFDDYGFEEQLGKERFAQDYWLSYVGPSIMFSETAKCANENNKHMYAKMQVCCSHEVATVPYIPVPTLIFRKYAGAHKYNVEGILQCWYFGNYPSIMSKAAGELSFMDDFSDEDGFLRRLAGILYGRSNAEAIAKAWKYFGEGYSNYPINIMFSYHGPMHDGVVWKLQLKPKNISPARTWLLQEESEGDRMCDALSGAHTLDEAIELSERMCDNWQKGMEYLPQSVTGEMQTLCEALGVMFDSGKNIMKFYKLRDELGLMRGDPSGILTEMRELVLSEIQNSEKMLVLCGKDSRLGYHSEAEAFKFYPAKLKERIAALYELLDTEFREVEQRISNGQAPLAYYEAEGEEYLFIGHDLESAEPQKVGKSGSFKMTYDSENVYLDIECKKWVEIILCFEGRIMDPAAEVVVYNGKFYNYGTYPYRQLLGERVEKELANYTIEETEKGCKISAKRAHIGWVDDTKPFKLLVRINLESWIEEENPFYSLGRWGYSAGQFGFVKANPKKGDK